MAERIKLGGLWQNKSKDGVDYLTGKLSPTVKILIFKNNYKQAGDNQPTHIMYLAPIEVDPNAPRPGAEQPDSFFGGEVGGAPGDDGGEGDDFTSAPAARPQAPRPQAAPAPRPTNTQSANTRPAQSSGAPTTPNRRPAPVPQPQGDDIGDFEDPFGD